MSDEMLSCGVKCYHVGSMLSCGINVIMWRSNVIMWDQCYHVGLNVIMWDQCYHVGSIVIICVEMLSCGIECYHVG